MITRIQIVKPRKRNRRLEKMMFGVSNLPNHPNVVALVDYVLPIGLRGGGRGNISSGNAELKDGSEVLDEGT